jgi:hypothetical protein
MLRRILIEIILFGLPFAVYFGGRALARVMKPGIELPAAGPRTPLLIAIGTALAVAGFVLTVVLEPRHRDQTFTPSYVDEDGKVVRGEYSTPATPPPAAEAPPLSGAPPEDRP